MTGRSEKEPAETDETLCDAEGGKELYGLFPETQGSEFQKSRPDFGSSRCSSEGSVVQPNKCLYYGSFMASAHTQHVPARAPHPFPPTPPPVVLVSVPDNRPLCPSTSSGQTPGVILDSLPIKFCWLYLSNLRTLTTCHMSKPTISHLAYCTCLTISLPPPPCPSVVQFQHSCKTDSFQRESEHVFPPLRTLQGSSCQRTSPGPYLDRRALTLAVPSAWNSCADTYRAHSVLKSAQKTPQ